MAATAPMQGAPFVVATQPIQQQHLPPVNLRFVKGLAVTQLCIGILSVIIGILVLGYLQGVSFTDYTGAGLWAGGWVCLTGSIGLCHSKNGRNLSCAYMALSIISTCTSLVAGILSGVGVFLFVFGDVCYSRQRDWDYDWDCNYRSQGIGLNVPLFILMIIEFIVSIVAAVLCCKNNGCGCCACCGCVQPGVVIQQQPYMPVAYPSGGYPSNTQYAAPQYGAQIAPQYGAQMVPQYGAQMVPQYGAQMVPQYDAQVQQAGGMQSQVMPLPYQEQQTNAMHLEKPPPYDGHN